LVFGKFTNVFPLMLSLSISLNLQEFIARWWDLEVLPSHCFFLKVVHPWKVKGVFWNWDDFRWKTSNAQCCLDFKRSCYRSLQPCSWKLNSNMFDMPEKHVQEYDCKYSLTFHSKKKLVEFVSQGSKTNIGWKTQKLQSCVELVAQNTR
jgi:hypothetical protein